MIHNLHRSFKLKKLEIYLVCLIPYFLVFSIFLADLIIVILSFLFISKVFEYRKFDYFTNKLFLFLSMYYLYIILISFISPDTFLSLKSSLFYFRFTLFPFIICFMIIEDKSFLKKFLISSLFLIIILAVDGTIEYFRGQNILGYEKYEIGRVASLFKDEYIYGTFILKIFFPISAIVYYISVPERKNIFFIIFYLLAFSLILISGDRTPLMLFLIASILILFFYNTKFLNKICFTLIFTTLFVSFLVSNKTLFDRLINTTLIEFGNEKGLVYENDRLTKFDYKDQEITFMPQHQTYMIISINMFKEKPLFGHGPRAFKKLSCEDYKINQFSCSSHPHNIYLQILAENGIIGFLCLFSAFAYISIILLNELFNSKKKKIFELQLLIIAIFINLFPITQTGNFYGNWNSIMFYLPVGFYLGMKKIIIDNKAHNL